VAWVVVGIWLAGVVLALGCRLVVTTESRFELARGEGSHIPGLDVTARADAHNTAWRAWWWPLLLIVRDTEEHYFHVSFTRSDKSVHRCRLLGVWLQLDGEDTKLELISEGNVEMTAWQRFTAWPELGDGWGGIAFHSRNPVFVPREGDALVLSVQFEFQRDGTVEEATRRWRFRRDEDTSVRFYVGVPLWRP